MSDVHRDRLQQRIENIERAKEFLEQLPESDVPKHSFIQRDPILSNIQKASKHIDDQHYDRHLSEALAMIAAQASAADAEDLADDARQMLDEFES